MKTPKRMAEYISQSMKVGSKDAAVLLYSPGAYPYFEDLAGNADRIFYFEEVRRAALKLMAKARPQEQKGQNTQGKRTDLTEEEKRIAHEIEKLGSADRSIFGGIENL